MHENHYWKGNHSAVQTDIYHVQYWVPNSCNNEKTFYFQMKPTLYSNFYGSDDMIRSIEIVNMYNADSVIIISIVLSVPIDSKNLDRHLKRLTLEGTYIRDSCLLRRDPKCLGLYIRKQWSTIFFRNMPLIRLQQKKVPNSTVFLCLLPQKFWLGNWYWWFFLFRFLLLKVLFFFFLYILSIKPQHNFPFFTVLTKQLKRNNLYRNWEVTYVSLSTIMGGVPFFHHNSRGKINSWCTLKNFLHLTSACSLSNGENIHIYIARLKCIVIIL